MSSRTVLTLVEANDTPRLVQIGPKTYSLRSTAHLTLAEGLRIDRLRGVFDEITKAGLARDLSSEEAAQLSDAIVALARMAVEAPADVMEKLSETQLIQIIKTAFFVQPTPSAPASAARSAQPSVTKSGTRRSRG